MSFGMSPSQVIVQQYFDKRRVLAGGFVICGMSVGKVLVWITFNPAMDK